MALRYRFTFIDSCDAERPSAPQRSASEPPLCTAPAPPCLEEEQRYVEGLDERIATSPMRSPGKDVTPDGGTDASSSPCTPASDAAGSPAQTIGLSVAPSARGQDVGAGLFQSGSEAHPHLCARACAFFAKGTCLEGPGCRFCHLGHEGDMRHLDRRHRDMLRRLSDRKVLGLILPQLSEQVRALDDSPATLAKLGDFVVAIGSSSTTGVEKLARHERILALGFRNRNARFLINALLRMLGDRRPGAAVAAAELVRHLSAMHTA